MSSSPQILFCPSFPILRQNTFTNTFKQKILKSNENISKSLKFCKRLNCVYCPIQFFFLRLAPEPTTVANLRFFFFPLLPKARQHTAVYSSCECLWPCHVDAAPPCPCPHPGSEPVKPRAAEVECATLTTGQPGWPR